MLNKESLLNHIGAEVKAAAIISIVKSANLTMHFKERVLERGAYIGILDATEKGIRDYIIREVSKDSKIAYVDENGDIKVKVGDDYSYVVIGCDTMNRFGLKTIVLDSRYSVAYKKELTRKNFGYYDKK